MRRRGAVASSILIAVLALGIDLARPPARQITTRMLLTSINLYQATVSKALQRAGGRCRFTPSCSHYGEAVIREHGALEGSWMAVKRIFRCGPWTPMGTYDPPPRVAGDSSVDTPVEGPTPTESANPAPGD
jgi:putative membrane protein insertion efficiency factor